MNRVWLTVILVLASVGAAQAQYKYIGANGEITYSDIPPPPSAKNVQAKNFNATQSTAGLPYELSLAVSKFPVTIYTSDGCPACDQARAYLKSRGVPFAEKTVTNAEDTDVLKKLVKDPSLPTLTVGSQKLATFTEASLGSLLDDAGYPATSKLPAGYVNPPAESAAPKPRAPQSAQSSSPAIDGAPPPASLPAAGNAPSGFKF